MEDAERGEVDAVQMRHKLVLTSHVEGIYYSRRVGQGEAKGKGGEESVCPAATPWRITGGQSEGARLRDGP